MNREYFLHLMSLGTEGLREIAVEYLKVKKPELCNEYNLGFLKSFVTTGAINPFRAINYYAGMFNITFLTDNERLFLVDNSNGIVL